MNMINGIIKKAFLSLTLIVGDMFAIFMSFVTAFYIRSWLLAEVFGLFPKMIHGLDVYLNAWVLFSLWLLIFGYEGLYPSVGMGFWDETKSLLKGNGLAFIIIILLTFLTKTSIQYSRPVIFLAFILSVVLLPVMRRSARSILRHIGLWHKDVLIVGSSETVKIVLCNLKKHPDWGLKPMGVVMPGSQKSGIPKSLPVYGDMEHIPFRVEEVIVAMPELSRAKLVEVVENAMKIAPVVKMLPDLYGVVSVGVKTYDLDGMLLLEMEDRLALRKNAFMKRTFDIICSLSAILFLSPLFGLIMALIRLDSQGPIFFGHKRLGKSGRHFTCYKFRTMLPNAQEILDELLENDPEARAQWDKDFKLKDDPRITKIGHFLRKTSLDELPQIWNVLKGDMSLVGPRPIVDEEVERYRDKSRYFFRVTPGITGLWQVSGRNDVDYDERVILDEYYAKNWSLWLDIELLMRTFGAVVKKKGAY